jgi:hypothetical protein
MKYVILRSSFVPPQAHTKHCSSGRSCDETATKLSRSKQKRWNHNYMVVIEPAPINMNMWAGRRYLYHDVHQTICTTAECEKIWQHGGINHITAKINHRWRNDQINNKTQPRNVCRWRSLHNKLSKQLYIFLIKPNLRTTDISISSMCSTKRLRGEKTDACDRICAWNDRQATKQRK